MSLFRPRDMIMLTPTSEHGSWLGFGGNIYNNHWAGSDAAVNTANIDTLRPFCEKEYGIGVSAAPLVEDGVAYYPTWNGLLVALDYQKCNTLWELNITELILKENGNSDAIVATGAALTSRTTPVSNGTTLFLGTLAHALLLAVNKQTGHIISTLSLSSHPLSTLTQSPTLYQNRLFIGLSTTESGAPSLDPTYKFSHKSSMHAITLTNNQTLTLLWTTPMIPPKTNTSGASIWGSQPSIDPLRNQLFIGTGQLFSLPPELAACQDANKNLTANIEHLVHEPCLPLNTYQTSILALDIVTGGINWYKTLGPLDAWNSACTPDIITGDGNATEPGQQCPENVGADADFGMAPAFVAGLGTTSTNTPGGKDIVVAGQKNGNLYAFSAQTGAVLWGRNVVPGGTEGGLSWGVAVDDGAVYYTGINSGRVEFSLASGERVSNSMFGAVDLKDGDTRWQVAAPRNMTSYVAPVVRTGAVLRDISLGAYFHGNIAVVKEYVMFGTGYRGGKADSIGKFSVYKVR
ncbi:Quino protein alcohol dehydrogenase-like protein [Plenodomus tracheiphilus IPT5]|uniref:Quino protein alcohol dehydrogenase-like protein n=1 Tax=Plenodomus tracheiphilus IPT5 TaxID=1408161 RepID=A0A6A7BJ34_9PLEO|nr:Quino protein alcohol dehydrogenase-like protein [Plenodomus tracheiphilus IPT5]